MLENNNINAEADELISDFTKYYTTISDNIPFGPRNNNVDNPKTFYRNQLDKVLHKQNSALYSYILGDNMTYSIDTYKVIFPFGFNESQKDAVLNALQNKISVIEGPPGTGKTQTILNIIANLVGSMNKTVGVVSLNNSAVDNVLEKLQENGYGFIAASLGSTAKKTAFFEHLPTFDSSTFNSDPVKAQAHLNYTDLIDLMKLFNKKAKLKYTLSEFKLEQEHFTAATLNENFKKIKKLPFFNMNSSELVSFMAEAQMAVISPKNKGMLYKAHLLFKYRFIDFKKLDKNYMDVISAFQKEYYNLKINEIIEEINRIEATLKNKKFDSILKNYKNWSKNVFDSLLYKRYCKKKPIELQITDFRSNYRNFKNFTSHYPVILSTACSLANNLPKQQLLDYVIIDESSQVDILNGILAMGCAKNVVIVGDLMQLTHIVPVSLLKPDLKESLAQLCPHTAYDYYKHNLLSSTLAVYQDTLPKEMLKEHYRCHPDIIGFCNKRYYNNQLIPLAEFDKNTKPFILYKTVLGSHARYIIDSNKKGHYNQRELDSVTEDILKSVNLSTDNHQVGFETPFLLQADKAGSVMSSSIQCDTVHKYQGREKDVMIMSTVLSKDAGENALNLLRQKNLINVAVSRAKKQFILVTHPHYVKNASEEVGALVDYIKYNTLDSDIMDSEITSVFDLLYTEYSDQIATFLNKNSGSSKYSSENIMENLLKHILSDSKYEGLSLKMQVHIKNFIYNSMQNLSKECVQYINNGASIDFVILRTLDKKPVLLIEVNGVAFHENKSQQRAKDLLKKQIFEKYDILLTLETNGSNEENKIRNKLDKRLEAIKKALVDSSQPEKTAPQEQPFPEME